MKKINLLIGVVCSCLLSIGLAVPSMTSATVPGNNQIVNLDDNDQKAATGYVEGNDVSHDGRYIVFTSQTPVLSSDTNGRNDVYLRDTVGGTTTRVSISETGTEGDGHSYNAKISYDGRYVVFLSRATNLMPYTVSISGTAAYQVYRYDRIDGSLEHISKTSGGSYSGAAVSRAPDINADGRFIVFSSNDKGLVSNPPIGGMNHQIVVKDMTLGTTKNVSVDPSTGNSNPSQYNGDSPSISCDGGTVAFSSSAYDSGVSPYEDIIVTTRAGAEHITNATISGNGHSNKPEVSCDGNHVVFQTVATNLLDSGAQPHSNPDNKEVIYKYNHVDKSIMLISKYSNGQPAVAGYSYYDRRQPSVNGDGRYVVFTSNTKLVSGSFSRPQVYIYDTVADTTDLLSKNSSGQAGDYDSSNPLISSNGKYAIFDSKGSNLVSGDTGHEDVFLAETGF